MATVLEHFDFKQPGDKPKLTRSKGYPWGEWFDGQIWRITHNEDFEIDPLMMERQLRTRASPLRLSIKIRHLDPGVIVFQATPLEEKVAATG